jgi:NTP pyrophosphatase (non-canonical NTP hydrolase)
MSIHHDMTNAEAAMLTLNDYQRFTGTMAQYPGAGTGMTAGIIYTALGLSDEVGEVMGKLKKAMRGDAADDVANATRHDGPDGPNHVMLVRVARLRGSEALKSEAGDVLWYLARFADENGWSLGEVAAYNMQKLAARKAAGTIKGSGDAR